MDIYGRHFLLTTFGLQLSDDIDVEVFDGFGIVWMVEQQHERFALFGQLLGVLECDLTGNTAHVY